MGNRKNHCIPYFMLLIFAFFSTGNNTSIDHQNTIYPNQTLSGDQTLISPGGSFELGFFNPSKSSSSKYYLGIWYKKISAFTVAWVANRDSPVSDTSSLVLKIVQCNLVLISSKTSHVIWSTNVTCSATLDDHNDSVIATLLDDGNLVVKKSVSGWVIWQSFDHLTDTWLLGAKLAYNKKTKTTQYISSWKNSEDPGTGLFSFEPVLDTSEYFTMWNRSIHYWRSGPWDGHEFTLMPEMRLNYIYNFTFVSNENESYFTYSLYNDSLISRLVMDVSGQLKQMTWLENTKEWNLFWAAPRQQCEIYSFCGAFGMCNQNSLPFCDCLPGFMQKSSKDWNLSDHSSGCVRKTNFSCGVSDGFMMISLTAFPDYYSQFSAKSGEECENTCSSNCSCIAYGYDNTTGKCFTWEEKLLNLRQADDDRGKKVYIRLASSDIPSTKQKLPISLGSIVGSVVALVTVLCLILVLVLWRRRSVGLLKNQLGGSLVAFRYRDLQHLTKNFSDKLGGGGFGSVFRGKMPDSTMIAVKRLDSVHQGEKQFRAEVSSIGTIQHINLVRLFGFCSEADKKLLVYEYLANGSLDSHLFHNDDKFLLSWETRYQIALGVARGLAYLHEKCRDCIIHCDIKPENILLNSEFCPKLADFGLAKLMGRDFSRVLTTIRGTRGYLAPEWISGVAITAKADVYSYGMMLLEIVSGRRNSEPFYNNRSDSHHDIQFFPCWVANVTLDEGRDILSLVDDKLKRNADEEQVMRICRVACWCIQDDENTRPSMGQVVQILEGVSDVEKPPRIPRTLNLYLGDTTPDNSKLVFFSEVTTSSGSKASMHSIDQSV